MINQEEYEILKECDGEYKWVSRDKNRELWVYTKEPYKEECSWGPAGIYEPLPRRREDLFQFIQWDDEEPYRISDLIKEYEIKGLRPVPSGTVIVDSFSESEETEVKKDLKEAILGIEVTQFDGQKADLEELVNPKRLEKIISDWMPEVLSQEWVDEHEEQEEMYGTYGVPVRKLQNLLVPKQELPVVPMWFDEWWKDVTKGGGNLFHNIERFYDELFSSGTMEAYNYISSPDNKKKLLNIIVNELEYEVEEEPLYYVMKDGVVILSKTDEYHQLDKSRWIGAVTNKEYIKENPDKVRFTEQEIKDYDERFWAFAVPVEELEE